MEMDGSPSKFRDWAHLPTEIVESISEKLKSITDLARFRAVCSSWRSATLSQLRHLPPQLPWLMLPYVTHPEWISGGLKDAGIRLFYDRWESRLHKLHLPESIGMTCCASYRGWLLLVETKGRQVLLLNPLTRARIELPPFTAPVKRLGDNSDALIDDAALWVNRNFTCSFADSKVIFSADLTNPNCLIIVFFRRCRVICYRVGDPCWTRIDIRDNYPADVTSYNGRFYLLYTGAMVIIDPNKPEEEIVYNLEPELHAASKCFLEGKSGVHVVSVHPKDKFELWQFQQQPLKLKQITDTCNNTAIFYGYPSLNVCTDDWDSLDGVSVHMNYKCLPYAGKCGVESHYSIFTAQKDGEKTEHVRYIGKEPPFWVAKQTMWFQPSTS
ncbi:F-box protein SKIP23 [Rhynchospora pubera]|uniref:F-box protein SKIP23 n=1 Tax=Rhynchospora pubera TaxID=906938 RepID=A0AAV8EZB0_9POAL|nr:F-box protein SKIP23 [Rhynchospora pubera]